MFAALKGLGPSVVRTVTPWIVGLLVTGLAKAGFDWEPTPEVYGLATTLVSAGWYALIRFLEENVSIKFGYALGMKGAPTYENRH